jgi:hypothetical protein
MKLYFGVFRVITLMMKPVISSETSVNIYQISLCNVLEGSHLVAMRTSNLTKPYSFCV